jgi:hypothetical protein
MDNNLHFMRSEPPLLAPVFRSDAQARLLASLLLTGDELTLSQLAERAATPYATAHREVARLVDAGILTERTVGRARLIAGNLESPLVDPLRRILAVSAGPALYLTEELRRIEGVQVALIYGSFAARASGVVGPPPQDVDVLIIGTPEVEAVYAACERVEAKVGRAVNPTIFTPAEVESGEYRGFLDQVAALPRLPLIGEWP